jgi:hypothetical protein
VEAAMLVEVQKKRSKMRDLKGCVPELIRVQHKELLLR